MPDAFQSGSSPMGPHGSATTADGGTGSGYTAISRAVEKWFLSRGIHHGALRAGGVFSEVRDGSEVIVFPYRRRGRIVNQKYRGHGKRFWMDAGGELIPWNIDCLQSSPDHVYFVEGEMDALAFIEAGIWNVISVPNGAAPTKEQPGDVPEPEQDDGFRYLWNCREELAGRRIVLAGDSDAPGVRLRHSLVARLGRANCDIVDWPEGCKDANDYLLEVGPEAFAEYVRASRKPYPIRGLWAWNDVLPTPPMETLDIGIPLLRQHVRLARGTVSLVTGIPNHGKSALVKQLACQMIKLHGWNVTIASFEDRVYANLMPELLRIMSGQGPSLEPWVVAARADAALVLAKHLSFIADEGYVDEPMTLKWFVDIARDAKARFGTAMLIVDPWNEIEHLWGRDQNETQYIGEALRDLRRLAVELDMHIMIVAHPTKVLDGQAPGLYHVSGSAHWANKVDVGLVVHQPHFGQGPGGPTEVYIRKIKRAELGQRGIVTLQFNAANDSFEAPAGRPFDDPDIERTAA
jgi:twinkle protein